MEFIRRNWLYLVLLLLVFAMSVWIFARGPELITTTSSAFTARGRVPVATPTAPVVLTVEPDVIDTVEFERLVNIPLPDERRNLTAVSYCFIECRAAARFELPQSQPEAFLDALRPPGVLQAGFYPFEDVWLPSAYGWWKPNQAQQYAGVRFRNDDYEYEIMIDQSNTENPVIYINVVIPQ